jgi:hypothetical protein
MLTNIDLMLIDHGKILKFLLKKTFSKVKKLKNQNFAFSKII